jgi:hypothetical protein
MVVLPFFYKLKKEIEQAQFASGVFQVSIG